MESIKEIRDHIRSVEQTLKITNAMYLISSAKLRKAREQLAAVEPYFQKISGTIADILYHSPELEHIFFSLRGDIAQDKRKVGFIVITGDKGLAGAYNHNVLKLAEERIAQTANPTLFLIGQEGRAYFAHKKITVDGEFMYTVQDPTLSRAREISGTFLRLFGEGELDELYVIYTEMITPLRLEPRAMKLLPLTRAAFPFEPPKAQAYNEFVTYVPNARAVLDNLIPGYLKGMLFGALVQSFCCEQNARMTAMDSSTKNARELVRKLGLTYNRARQSAITQEITEVVGGARAQKRRKQG